MARPNLSYLKNVTLFLCGLPFGALTGLTGLSVSALLAPAARWLQGLRPHRATATALAVTGFAALAALLTYAQDRDVRLGVGVLLAMGRIAGATGGTWLIVTRPSLLRLRLLWGVLVTALGLTLAAQGRDLLVWHPWLAPFHGVAFWGLAVAVAIGVGFISRIMEVSGILLVPAILDLLRLPPHLAQGTALVALLLAALPNMLVYARRGDLEPQATVWLSVGGVVGALLGSYWTSLLRSDSALLILDGVVVTVIGVAMLWAKEPSPSAAKPSETNH